MSQLNDGLESGAERRHVMAAPIPMLAIDAKSCPLALTMALANENRRQTFLERQSSYLKRLILVTFCSRRHSRARPAGAVRAKLVQVWIVTPRRYRPHAGSSGYRPDRTRTRQDNLA